MIFASSAVKAQDGAGLTYSPYSVFGIGDLYPQGTTRERAMGGVGIAGRDPRYINLMNPAAISARDTLSFVFDAGMVADNRVFRQGDLKSANNTLNINNFSCSFPVYKSFSVLFGLTPYSTVGYDYSYEIPDPDLMATAGFINYLSSGKGGIYQGFAGFGVEFWKRISIGAEVMLNFGNISKDSYMGFSDATFRSMNSGYDMELRAVSGKLGVQYDQPVGDLHLTLGATYRTSSKLKGYVKDYKYATLGSVVDTVYNRVDTLSALGNVSLASEIGVGISLKKPEKWLAEFNYIRSDWTSSGFDTASGFANVGGSVFSTQVSQSFRAGFEYIPNRNDLRYYLRQCAYRMGAYYEQSYYKLDGNSVNSYGLTLGVTLPVFRWYNGISIGVDLGRKGSRTGNMTMENYASVVIGFHIHDMWFRKVRYQ